MDNTVVGVYESYEQAQNAMNELLSAGFSRSDVQISPDGGGVPGGHAAVTSDNDSTGGGSAIGNFFRSLFGMDNDSSDRDLYAEAVRRGNCVLSVTAGSDELLDRATEIMNRYDPIDIDEHSSHWRSQGWAGSEDSAPMYTTDETERERSRYAAQSDTAAGMNATSTDNWTGDSDRMNLNPAAGTAGMTGMTGMTSDMDRTRMGTTESAASLSGDTDTGRMRTADDTTRIPVVEEQLQVGKRQVQRGGVRVYQRMRETPVNESVNLRQEHVHVERHPVDQPASEADLAAFRDGSMELREMAEEPVVSKTARVVEEVVVGKDVNQQTEKINDTVRRTDVDVEQLGAADDRTATGSMGHTDYDDTRAVADDADYRKHWQTAYGSSGTRYEDYDSAYRYGSTLAGSERYKNYRWEDVEPQARSDWEQNHPESTWEKVKDAVRYGAERVSGNQQRY